MFREGNPTIPEEHNWFFIGAAKANNKTTEQTIVEEVHKKTNIILKEINFISSIDTNDRMRYFYHADLTDENVNHMRRTEGEILNFYTLHELEKLKLASSTQLFITKHRDILEKKAQK